MRSVTQLKSLGDIRTTISTHSRATPAHEGTIYLDILSMGMEQLRLKTELAWLDRRQGRIQRRLGEIRGAMKVILSKAQAEEPPASGAPAVSVRDSLPLEECGPGAGKWRRMTLDY